MLALVLDLVRPLTSCPVEAEQLEYECTLGHPYALLVRGLHEVSAKAAFLLPKYVDQGSRELRRLVGHIPATSHDDCQLVRSRLSCPFEMKPRMRRRLIERSDVLFRVRKLGNTSQGDYDEARSQDFAPGREVDSVCYLT